VFPTALLAGPFGLSPPPTWRPASQEPVAAPVSTPLPIQPAPSFSNQTSLPPRTLLLHPTGSLGNHISVQKCLQCHNNKPLVEFLSNSRGVVQKICSHCLVCHLLSFYFL